MDPLEESPWASAPAHSAESSQQADGPDDQPSQTSTASSTSGLKSPTTPTTRSRLTPRRLVAQPTKLSAVDDDPLGPLGAPTPDPAASTGDAPPAPPLKEQLPLRTTMPAQQQAARKGPADPHRIYDDDEESATRRGVNNADGAGASGARQPPPVTPAQPSPVRSTSRPSVPIVEAAAARPTFSISVGDPHKVGDLTSSHTEYSVRTRTTSKAYRSGNSSGESAVNRRYNDFVWLYNTLHANNPGVVVPPPPEKQAMGRFDSNFVESRRAALERMLNRMAAHPGLQNDGDLRLFLESESFHSDVKHREVKGGALGESKGVLGSLGFGGGGGSKFVEQDDWFHDRRVYLDALENQLRSLLKAMDTMVTQRKGMALAASEFSTSLSALATVELSPSLAWPLDALADLQLTIRDVYDRQAQQDVLTFGITLDEYIRLIGSAKQAFSQRQRAFGAWSAAENELTKRKAQQDKLLRQGKSQQDRLSQVQAEVSDAERKVHQARLLFEDMGRLMRAELDRFEREKVEDFKSSVETFLESAVEAQKELIEKWETFLMRLDEDETEYYKPSPPAPQAAAAPPQQDQNRPPEQLPAGGTGEESE